MTNAVLVKSLVIYWWLWQEKQSQVKIVDKSQVTEKIIIHDKPYYILIAEKYDHIIQQIFVRGNAPYSSILLVPYSVPLSIPWTIVTATRNHVLVKYVWVPGCLLHLNRIVLVVNFNLLCIINEMEFIKNVFGECLILRFRNCVTLLSHPGIPGVT